MTPETFIVGIDAAVKVSKRGAILARFDGGALSADEVLPAAAAAIGRRIADLPPTSRVLLCIDAPLGWPSSLSQSLSSHVAGEAVSAQPNQLFRRESDRWIKRNIDQQPLDVGADHIARTAHAALELLRDLREIVDRAIPLAWSPEFAGIACIEVYPAATLRARGLSSKGYKARTVAGVAVRERLLGLLSLNLSPPVRQGALAIEHIFDAVLCALTGSDFLCGACAIPSDAELARREGWIWVKHP